MTPRQIPPQNPPPIDGDPAFACLDERDIPGGRFRRAAWRIAAVWAALAAAAWWVM